MALINKYPYSDFENLNLDWIIQTVKTYEAKFIELYDYTTEAVKDLTDKVDGTMDYIRDNLATIANDLIIQMVQDGTLYVDIQYIPETEELNIILTEDNNG